MVPLVSTGDFKSSLMQSDNQVGVKLQKRLTAGADDESFCGTCISRPFSLDGCCKRISRRKVPAAVSVGIGKIGVAELADRRCAILFAP